MNKKNFYSSIVQSSEILDDVQFEFRCNIAGYHLRRRTLVMVRHKFAIFTIDANLSTSENQAI